MEKWNVYEVLYFTLHLYCIRMNDRNKLLLKWRKVKRAKRNLVRVASNTRLERTQTIIPHFRKIFSLSNLNLVMLNIHLSLMDKKRLTVTRFLTRFLSILSPLLFPSSSRQLTCTCS